MHPTPPEQTTASPQAPARHGWRKLLPVHPAADVFPLLPPDELAALGEDIRRNGLRELPTIWLDAKSDDTFDAYLTDGRNRLDAMEAMGAEFVKFTMPPELHIRLPGAGVVSLKPQVEIGDPGIAVVSANIHRRHLTPAERANLAIRAIEAAGSFVGHPAKPGRPQGLAAKVAKVAGVSKDTALEQIAVLRDNELKLALAERRLSAVEAARVVRLRIKKEREERDRDKRAEKYVEMRAATEARRADLERRFMDAATEHCRREPDSVPDLLRTIYRATVSYGFEKLFESLIVAWGAEAVA